MYEYYGMKRWIPLALLLLTACAGETAVENNNAEDTVATAVDTLTTMVTPKPETPAPQSMEDFIREATEVFEQHGFAVAEVTAEDQTFYIEGSMHDNYQRFKKEEPVSNDYGDRIYPRIKWMAYRLEPGIDVMVALHDFFDAYDRSEGSIDFESPLTIKSPPFVGWTYEDQLYFISIPKEQMFEGFQPLCLSVMQLFGEDGFFFYVAPEGKVHWNSWEN